MCVNNYMGGSLGQPGLRDINLIEYQGRDSFCWFRG